MPPRLDEFDFAGKKIYTLQGSPLMFICTPSWCLTEKEVVVALVRRASRLISRGADFKSLAQSPALADSLRGDGGPLKLMYGDSKQLFDTFYPTALSFLSFAPIFLQQTGVDLNVSVLPSPG